MIRRTLFFLLALPLFAAAQPELGAFDHPGSILLQDGTEQKGFLRTYGSTDEPWHYQSTIRFMDSTTWNGLKKARNKDFKKYDPDEIKGYLLSDENITYLSKPFADMSSVSIKMIKKQYFMRGIVLGKINFYHYYDAPPNVYIGKDGEYEKIKQESAMNNYALVEKEAGKLKNITDIDLRETIAECPAVLKKYEAGDYGPSPMDTGKKKGLGKFVAKVIDSNKMKDYAAPLFRDYNNCQ